MEGPSVTTARAAEIVGIGYEGLRSQLKRGLLKNVGTLPPFSGADAEGELLYAKRWRWSKFGIPDLCLMRVAKILMDTGCAFEVANDIASTEELWRWFAHAKTGAGLFLTVLPDRLSFSLYTPEQYPLITSDHAGYEKGIILISLGAIFAEITAAALEPDAIGASSPVDQAMIEALYADLARDNGMAIVDLQARLDDLFERPRDEALSVLLAERRAPWKVLADEVLPVMALLSAKATMAGRVRFPQDDTAYDAHVQGDDGAWTRIEVTGALSRAQIALAEAQREDKVKAGFLGLPDQADPKAYAAALKRPRVMHSRRGVEMQVEAGIRAALAKKDRPKKYGGGTLLVAAPLMRLPDDPWEAMAQRLTDTTAAMPFDAIYAIDDRKQPPRILTLK